MVTEMITLKLDDLFLQEIDKVVQGKHYQNRTEFIREALREKVDQVHRQEIIAQIVALKGASKKKTTNKELERIRQEAFAELDKQL